MALATASAQSDRPFRARSLAAVLTRLSCHPASARVSPMTVEWCRREGVHLHAEYNVKDASLVVREALFASLPSLTV